MMYKSVPRLLIAAPKGRSGKTTITMGIIAALVSKGVKVQPFKKGPDFIDPSWLTFVAKRACRNLDSFLMDKEKIKASFVTHSQGADVSIIEGAMGLYDGVDVEGSGSAAEIAKTVKAPVILVVDCTRITRSVAALVQGFKNFDKDVNIAGIILNNVARSRHENMLRASIEKYCDLPILGAVPKNKRYNIPDRHLGLIPAGEDELLHKAVEQMEKAAKHYIDIDALLNIAASAGNVDVQEILPSSLNIVKRPNEVNSSSDRPIIGVILDQSFTFYYPENLEALYNAGAEIVSINAIDDTELPMLDGLFIGGGFPEVAAAKLERNESLKLSIKNSIERGMPVYAECGGLMYLGRTIAWEGDVYQMVGALPFDVEMTDKPQGHGYMEVKVSKENPFFPVGMVIRGHEFHNSKIVNIDMNKVDFVYEVKRGWGINGKKDGLVYKNVLASYNHLHALAIPCWAENFVRCARKYKKLFKLT
ncbi:MAG: hydrogenobyrinic acid a,c-diamide synthase (glutamine-hydrolyzing) [Desulfotomaculum sp.]|nr:hydrogenobyrinic acid a,c-diamide synthase (glutamine-hydrolyzing) [Desulfotomaculum sp.]